MALSYEFKRAMKHRTRRWRRIAVLTLCVCVAIGVAFSDGFHAAMLQFYLWPLIWIFAPGQPSWSYRRRVIPVATLDDRAMLEHGQMFETLSPTQQREIMDQYCGGTLLLGDVPDEREHELQSSAHLRAYAMMRWLLPVLALMCVAMWKWVPRTNVLLLLFWFVIVVLALPQMILMWTEPEDAREMQIAPAGQEA